MAPAPLLAGRRFTSRGDDAQARTGAADAGGAPGRRSLAGRTTTVTFSSEEEYREVKLAFDVCGLQSGFRSMNDFFTEAILIAVEELERQHNGGQPFTPDDIPARRRRRT
jgi:hypothetical protein